MAQGQAEIRPLLKPYRGQMNLARAMLILKAALSSATAYATGAFVDAAIAHSTGPALLWLGAIAGATALQMIDRRFYSIVVGRLTVRVRRDFRVRLFSGLLKSGELKEKPAELASRLSGDVGRITVKNVFIPVQFPHLVIQLALAMGLVVYSSPSLALLIGASVPLLAWVARFYGRRLASLEEAAATRQAGMTHTGMGLLEIAPRREGVRRAVRSYARAAGRYEKVNFKLVEAGADLDALRETLQLLFTDVLVLGLGLLSFLHFGAPSVGQVMSMRGYARDLRSAVDGFIDAYVGGKDAEGGTRRVIELLRGSQASRRKG
jgi:ABC-type multidrug transport system fused ATPase/permease subunit